MQTFAGFLKGINVGGHHKVPMVELCNRLNEVGCMNVKTLLNTGNFVFDFKHTNIQDVENKIEDFISKSFGFPIPVFLKTKKEISELVEDNPFKKINIYKDIRLYVSFFKETPKSDLIIPDFLDDENAKIIEIKDKTILSVLDLSTSKTTKSMEKLEKLFGKNITTRNWNTIIKINEIK